MADLQPTHFERLRAHELEHHHGLAHPPIMKPALPIPDLRFEYSYLRGVRPFVNLIRTEALPSTVSKIQEDEEGFEELGEGRVKNGEEVLVVPKSETLDIQWKRVFWATTRDQVLMPFLQGALWALASFYLSPYSSGMGRKMGSYVRSKLPAEGSGSAWLRGVVRQMGLSSTTLTP